MSTSPDPEIENLLALLSALEYLEEAEGRENVKNVARANARGAIEEALSRELD
jgi:hypothetical protein